MAPKLLASTLAILLLSSVAGSSSSCAGINFRHQRIDMEPPARMVQAIRPGQVDLEVCLDKLGAPNSVERSQDGKSHILTWAWDEQSSWGFFIELPLGDASPSFNWDSTATEPQYLRLFFDAKWNLLDMAQG